MHRIAGLDWAHDAIRVAVLESGFRGFTIQDVRTAPLPEGGAPGERLKAALEALGLSPALNGEDAIAVALPGALAATHVLTLPFVDARRIEQVLPAEVESVTPFDLGEVIWDYAVLSQSEGKSEVLVGIVRKTALRDHLAALEAAGIEPRLVTLAPLALAALGERGVLPGGDAAAPEGGPTAALLDAGPDRADFTLLERGRPTLARALSTAPAATWTTEAGRARALQTLVRDVKISLKTRSRTAPQQLYLAGALAQLPGAAEHLSAELSLPAAAVPMPHGGPDGSLALGLALRAQQPRGRINFRKGEFAFTRDLSQVRGQLARLAVAAGILLVLGIGLGMARLSSLHRQARSYDDAVCAATKRILGTCLTDYRQALAQLSGGKSRAAGIPRVSGADVFAELLAHLPEDAGPLEDVEITTTSLRVKGVAESFGKVDELIAGLKKDKCFGEIKQPRVEKQREGSKVSFALDFPYVCSGETPGGT